jgi:hypothetical protein
MIVFFTSAGVKENRTILLCKKSGGDAEIGEVEDQDPATDSPTKIAMNTIVCHAGAMSGRLDRREVRLACVVIVPPPLTC